MTENGKALMQSIYEGFEKQMPDEKVRRIILNAMEVFARKGLYAAKIKDIAMEAGFSQGFVYNYFKSKDDIFTRIVALAVEGAESSVIEAGQLKGTPFEKIYWLTEALLSYESIAMHHWKLIMLQAVSPEAVPPKARVIFRDNAKKPIERLVPIIIEGQKAGQIAGNDPVVLAITYFSIIQGLGIMRMQGGNEIPFPSIDMVLSFLK